MLADKLDDALQQGMPVLLFVYEEDADLQQESPTLNHIEVTYSQVHVERLRRGETRAEIRQFSVKALPTLLVVTGKSKPGSYVVAAFEAPLDEQTITRFLNTMLVE